MLRAILLFSLVMTSGLAAAKVKYPDNSIGANSAIANKLVEKKFGSERATALLTTPYDGFYQISGKFRDNRINFEKIKSKKSFPDNRWEQMAREIAQQVDIQASSSSSRIKPKATAYVVFYKDNYKDLDLGPVQRARNSMEGEPNGVAVLMIKRKASSKATRDNTFNKSSSRENRNGTSLYVYEVSI